MCVLHWLDNIEFYERDGESNSRDWFEALYNYCFNFFIYGFFFFFFCGAGRVNLIGEHIDYEGYSVLPMAIRQDTIVAIRKNESEQVLRIGNVNDEKYTTCTYPADPHQVNPQ